MVDRAKEREKRKRYLQRHPEKAREKQRKKRDRQRETLSDQYVRSFLGLRADQVTPELVEMKRQLIAMRRLQRDLKRTVTQLEKQNGD